MVGEIEADEEWIKVAKANVPFVSQGSYGQRGPKWVSEELMVVSTKERVNTCLVQKMGSRNPVLPPNSQTRAIPFIS